MDLTVHIFHVIYESYCRATFFWRNCLAGNFEQLAADRTCTCSCLALLMLSVQLDGRLSKGVYCNVICTISCACHFVPCPPSACISGWSAGGLSKLTCAYLISYHHQLVGCARSCPLATRHSPVPTFLLVHLCSLCLLILCLALASASV